MIIIETPQPPVKERLILVREGEPLAPRRDATPEDLQRAGFVSRADAMLFASRNAIDEYRNEGESRSDAIHRLARERDEARGRAEKAEGLLVQRETELRLAREAHDAAKASEVVWAGRARDAERERDEARAALAAWQGSAACLVTRAVEANVDIRVCEDDGGGFMVGVHAPGDDEDLERHVPAADVPATLARLLGEVTK